MGKRAPTPAMVQSHYVFVVKQHHTTQTTVWSMSQSQAQRNTQSPPTTIPELWRLVEQKFDDVQQKFDDVAEQIAELTHGLHMQTEVTVRDYVRQRQGSDYVIPKSLRNLRDITNWLRGKTRQQSIQHIEPMQRIGLQVAQGQEASKLNGHLLFQVQSLFNFLFSLSY
jgi:hypothetical protein